MPCLGWHRRLTPRFLSDGPSAVPDSGAQESSRCLRNSCSSARFGGRGRAFQEGGAVKSLRCVVRLQGGLGAPCPAVPCLVLGSFSFFSFIIQVPFFKNIFDLVEESGLQGSPRLGPEAVPEPQHPRDTPVTQTFSTPLASSLCLLMKAEFPCQPNASSLASVYPRSLLEHPLRLLPALTPTPTPVSPW